MTTTATASRLNSWPRWVFPFLAAFVAVSAMILGTASASNATTTGTETRVGAHTSSAGILVGASDQIAAGQRLGNNHSWPENVVATGAAAKTGSALPEGYSSFSAAKRAMGSPGEGNVFDHVVEQSQIKRSGFAADKIHNPFNMNPVSARTNQIKANYYSSKQPFSGGGTVRDWLSGQSFADQYSFGMDALTQIRRGTIQ